MAFRGFSWPCAQKLLIVILGSLWDSKDRNQVAMCKSSILSTILLLWPHYCVILAGFFIELIWRWLMFIFSILTCLFCFGVTPVQLRCSSWLRAQKSLLGMLMVLYGMPGSTWVACIKANALLTLLLLWSLCSDLFCLQESFCILSKLEKGKILPFIANYQNFIYTKFIIFTFIIINTTYLFTQPSFHTRHVSISGLF